ncbi:9086_t:CDS:2, partial [Paraglomus occultum]
RCRKERMEKDNVITFLQKEDLNLDLDDEDIEIIRRPAFRIAKLVKKIRGEQDQPDTELCLDLRKLIYFIDDSNSYIEGKYVTGEPEKMGVGERAGIRQLTKKVVTHDQWVEGEYAKEQRKVSTGSENFLEVIARLIDVSMYRLPVECDIEIARAERRSQTIEDCRQESRGNKPNIIIRSIFRNKWEELVYIESGREAFGKKYIGFGVNIAGNHIEISGLIRQDNIKYYLPVSRAKIPFGEESVEEVEDFIHALLTLRNRIIVNAQCISNKDLGKIVEED